MSTSASTSDAARRWRVAFVLAAIFGAIQINQSLMMGSLSLPPTYDAVTYYGDGAMLLQKFHQGGFAEVLSKFFRYPPHSPLSTGLAFVGFSVFGIKNWVGPLTSTFILFFFVRLFFEAAKSLPLGQATILAAALLGFPLVGHTVMDFRPDMICGLLIATGTLLIVARSSWLHTRRDQFIVGLVFAAALWAKPSIFPLTIGLFGAAMTLASVETLRGGDLRGPARAALLTTGTAILLSLPYYAYQLPQTINYIRNTAFGTGAEVWVLKMSMKDHVLFYLTGLFGWQSIGSWLYIGTALCLSALWIIWWSSDRPHFVRASLVGIMVLVAYAAVTAPEFKGPHGFSFAAIFLGAIALSSIALAKRLAWPFDWIFCVALLLVSLWQFTWPYQASYNNRIVSPDYAETRWQMLHKTMQALGNDVAGKTMFLVTHEPHLNHAVLAFEYLAEGRTPPKVEYARANDDPAVQRARIAKSDFVFAPTPDAGDVLARQPTASSSFRAEMIRLTEETGKFGPPVRIPDPVRGGAVLIYKHLPVAP